jgi:hypothetical protein
MIAIEHFGQRRRRRDWRRLHHQVVRAGVGHPPKPTLVAPL